jgi:hypothetical protein
MEWLFGISADHWAHASARDHRWRGLALYGVDGTTLRVPDSKDNARHFGYSHSVRGESAYPMVRVVGLMTLRSHLLAAVTFGPYETGEISYAATLWPSVPRDSLTIVDRGFFSARILTALARDRENRHWLIRAKKNLRWRTLQRLGPRDALVEMDVSKEARRKDPSLPQTWVMRAITYQRKGFLPSTLLTSLLDPVACPADEIAVLYHERWELEVSHSCCSPCDRPIYVSVDAEKIAPSDVDDRGFSVDPVARARRRSEAAGGPSCVERAAGRRNTTRDALVEPTTSMSAPQRRRASSAMLERSAGKTASATHAWALGARRAAERAPERRPRSPTDDGTRRAGGCGPSLDESKSKAKWSASRAWRRDPAATTHSRAVKISSGTSATRAPAGDGACRSGSAPCWR